MKFNSILFGLVALIVFSTSIAFANHPPGEDHFFVNDWLVVTGGSQFDDVMVVNDNLHVNNGDFKYERNDGIQTSMRLLNDQQTTFLFEDTDDNREYFVRYSQDGTLFDMGSVTEGGRNDIAINTVTGWVGIGTANPQAKLHVDGFTVIDGPLSIGPSDFENNDSIFFDSGTEFLQWSEIGDSFLISNDLNTYGSVSIGNLPDDDDFLLFDTKKEFIKWDEGQTRFETSDELTIAGPLLVGFQDNTPVAYSRIGGTTSNHGLNGINDLLITDELEVDGKTYLDNTLEVSSGISALDFSFSSAKTRVLSIGHQEFSALVPQYIEVGGSSLARWIESSPFALPFLKATIHTIPDGATITDFECHVVDNSADHNIGCGISAIDENGTSVGFSTFDVTSSGSSTTKQVLSPSSPTPINLDRDTRSYYVDFSTDDPDTDCGFSCQILHVKITYTVTNLD